MSRRAKAILQEGRTAAPLPPEFLRDAKRGGVTTLLTVVLLGVTLSFMVYSGFGP